MDSSLPCHLAYGNLNGDGFGIGWFSPDHSSPRTDPSPCVFTSVTPAWCAGQLAGLAGCISAHADLRCLQTEELTCQLTCGSPE